MFLLNNTDYISFKHVLLSDSCNGGMERGIFLSMLFIVSIFGSYVFVSVLDDRLYIVLNKISKKKKKKGLDI